MKKTALPALLALSAATALAGVAPPPPAPPPLPVLEPCAGPVSYSNVELLYANTDWDGYGDSADGGILRAEYSPMQNLYLAASVEYQDISSGDLWFFSIGAGGYVPLTENIHLAADAGYLYARYDFDFDVYDSSGSSGMGRGRYRESEDGWYARPYLRAKWGCFSLKAGAIYRDIDHPGYRPYQGYYSTDDGGQWSWFVQLYYQLNQNWDITAGYEDSDDSEQLSAGVRFRY